MPPAIRVDGLSKLYQVGARQQGYKTLRESIADAFWAPFRSLSRWERAGVRAGQKSEVRGQGSGARSQEPAAKSQESGAKSQEPGARLSGENFWALKDVSFEVQPGEVVGIIGRNGAGKSTLLKILSRITEPTSGRIELRGRVGSLLEVGTGFHPELTGRENIYMNGSILGMSRREIQRKFDEIVAFAEIDDFLDTPVKRYSSGMYVRLAFAVAAHLEPEILIVDEVLAVGDAAFQQKSLGKMRAVARAGRTVLFVSHNMAAIESLCATAVELQCGTVAHQGVTASVLSHYRQSTIASRNNNTRNQKSTSQTIMDVAVVDDDSNSVAFIPLGGDCSVRILVNHSTGVRYTTVGIGIDNALGQRMLTVFTPCDFNAGQSSRSIQEIRCRIPRFPLAPGEYSVKCALAQLGHEVDSVENAVHFMVADGNAFEAGRGFHRGVCVAPCEWTAP